MNRVRVPRSIDKQIMLLFWQFDELCVIVFIMGIGIFVDYMIVSMLVGFVAAHFYRKWMDGKLRMQQLHFMYWHGAALQNASKTMPGTDKREFIQ
ncbi:MAG: type IV conjugative transfer system protein TraL [Oleiphilus sp.]|nr:MAG: type IV conjugative transfer system protein TraL [Oleiphilus sp.]